MKSLPIVWQRLVDAEGRTCDRCGLTEEAVRRAVAQLEDALRPLGIAVRLESRALDRESFEADPSQSNRIWIAGRPLESWLDARVASSPCCSVCGDAACRAIELEAAVFEAIPAELIVKAALRAAAELIAPAAATGREPAC